MADIRCQMCGKLNPSDQEVCQFCQARLRPIWAPPPPEEESFAGPSEEGDEIPDWLRSLRGSELTDMGEGSASSEVGSPEWLGEFAPESFEPESVSNVFNLPPEEKLEDWLSGTAPLTEPETPPAEAGSFEQVRSELGFLEEPPFSSASPEEEKESSDWLERIQGSQGFKEEAGAVQPPFSEPVETPSEEVPDWLERIREAELADWLTPEQPEEAAGMEQPESFSVSPVSAEEAPEEGLSEALPDWFSQILEVPGGAEQPAVQPEEEGLEAVSPAKSAPESAESEGMPDWLTSLYSGEGEVPSLFGDFQEPAPAAQARADQIDQPDKFAGHREIPEEEELEKGEAPEISAEPAPDWLAELEKQRAVDFGEAGSQPVVPPFENFDAELLGSEQEVPEWLVKLESFDSGAPSATAEGEAVPPFLPEQPFEPSAETDAFAGLPDWLAKISAEPEETAPFLPEEAGKPPSLAPSELPTWLESMRPTEVGASAVPFKDDTDARLEKSGPLSGLSGVLPVGAHVIRPRKPSVFSIKLQVTEELQNRALLLQKLIEDESKPKPLAEAPRAPALYLIRLGLLIFLVMAVFFALWGGGNQVPRPVGETVPQALAKAYQKISALPSNSVVLLGVDYDPGYAGEIEGAAQAVVNHLVRQGSVLVAVSTTSNGPAMTERLFKGVDPALVRPGQLKNLGYIPGGRAGLYGFAQSPEQVAPFTLNGEYPWLMPPLDAQKGMENFALVVVITEDADTARSWIEQVGPSLPKAPMLMVLSAQAEPMIQPYYQGSPQQVLGMVVGMQGGAAYENLIGRAGPASRAWDAYSIASTMSLILLFVGGFLSAGYGLFARNKQSKAEAMP